MIAMYSCVPLSSSLSFPLVYEWCDSSPYLVLAFLFFSFLSFFYAFRSLFRLLLMLLFLSHHISESCRLFFRIVCANLLSFRFDFESFHLHVLCLLHFVPSFIVLRFAFCCRPSMSFLVPPLQSRVPLFSQFLYLPVSIDPTLVFAFF